MKRLLNNILFKYKNPTCITGRNVSISRFARVGKNCIISDNVTLKKSVFLGDNVVVGKDTSLVNITVGSNSVIESGVKVVGDHKGKIFIGDHSYIGFNNILDSSDNITIGNFVHIAGPSTALWCHSSAKMSINSIPLNDSNKNKYKDIRPITIADNVYIGGNCTIYPGVNINCNSIVAPNSAINKDVDLNSLVGGVPGRFIKKI